VATTTQEPSESGILDTIKLLIAAGVLVGGLYSYYYFLEIALPLRVLMVLGGLAAGITVAMTSTQGQRLWAFIQGARVEIRKVVWPTKQETTQTAIAVFVFCNCSFRFHINYGVVFLGSGFVPALVDTHLGWFDQLSDRDRRG
jgi:preprotein translocase subunit SecE